MRLIAVTNRKGGVGKTTIAMAIAAILAETFKVLLVDADSDQAQAYLYSTGDEHPLSGKVVKSSFGYFVVYLMSLDDMPTLREYDYVIIDGRPAGFVNSVIGQYADLAVVPYITPSDFQMGQQYFHMCACPVMFLWNKVGLYAHHWSGVQDMQGFGPLDDFGTHYGIPFDDKFVTMQPNKVKDFVRGFVELSIVHGENFRSTSTRAA